MTCARTILILFLLAWRFVCRVISSASYCEHNTSGALLPNFGGNFQVYFPLPYRRCFSSCRDCVDCPDWDWRLPLCDWAAYLWPWVGRLLRKEGWTSRDEWGTAYCPGWCNFDWKFCKTVRLGVDLVSVKFCPVVMQVLLFTFSSVCLLWTREGDNCYNLREKP